MTTIGDYAFSSCSGLTSVTIGNSVTTIGDYAFSSCSRLTSVTIPNSVTTIGDYAFDGCTGLTSVTIPNSVTTIGDYAFYWCTRLISVTIPNSVTKFGTQTFGICPIQTLYWDANVNVSLGSTKSALKELYIGDNATIIYTTFYGYSNLNKVVLGKSVKYLRSEAFEGCGIKNFYVTGDEAPYCYPNVFSSVDLSSATLYVPNDKASYYQTTEPWKNFSVYKDLIMIEDISFEKDAYKFEQGEKGKLNVSISPENISLPELTFASSDESVVKINASTGEYECLKVGTATVTATSVVQPEKMKSVTVTVLPISVKGLSFEKENYNIYIGDH